MLGHWKDAHSSSACTLSWAQQLKLCRVSHTLPFDLLTNREVQNSPSYRHMPKAASPKARGALKQGCRNSFSSQEWWQGDNWTRRRHHQPSIQSALCSSPCLSLLKLSTEWVLPRSTGRETPCSADQHCTGTAGQGMGSVFKIIFYLERYMINVKTRMGAYCKLGHKIRAFGPRTSLCL